MFSLTFSGAHWETLSPVLHNFHLRSCVGTIYHAQVLYITHYSRLPTAVSIVWRTKK